MKDYSRKFRIWEGAALIALCLSLCTGTWAQARQNAISSELVRLHVIAVSDDKEEQQIKLKVRDAVLGYLESFLKDAESPQEAKAIICGNLNGIAEAAGKAAMGRKVSVSLEHEKYPTKNYEGFSLPAGSYDSLKVVLGQGSGHNWWCIVFPPLCLDSAQAEQVQSVMSREDFKIVSDGENYKIGFRVVELWGELTNYLANK